MCGIVGLAWQAERKPEAASARVERMAATIFHRGPDSQGLLSAPFAQIGFRRLSIIDLETGDQPVANESKTVQVLLNGEIYNHRELRKELEAKGHQFRGRSDAEVLPHLYEEYGIGLLDRLNGMFAICICDHERGLLFLARDRQGIKPLYYAERPEALVFGSEIKALLASGLVEPELNPHGVAAFLDLFYCPGPDTLVAGVYKLLPGEYLEFRPGGISTHFYYRLPLSSEREALPPDYQELDFLLEEAVSLQLVADVPVGISLSGGLDSSLLTLYASRQSRTEVNLFTVNFPGTPPAEMECAQAVAQHFGLNHVVFSASVDDFLSHAPRMAWFSDEPVADPAFFSAMRVAEVASSVVKVLLSGTGADELFAGYGHHRLSRKKRMVAAAPSWLRDSRLISHLFAVMGRSEELPLLRRYQSDRLPWHARAMENFRPAERDRLLEALPGSRHPLQKLQAAFTQASACHPLDRQLFADTVTYLPDQLLTVLDRTTMSASIEGRVPFLDHRVVEHAFRTSGRYKVLRPTEGKALLRQLARGRLPEAVLRRSKLGFPNAVLEWIDSGLGTLLPRILERPGSFATSFLPPDWVRRLFGSPEVIRMEWRAAYALLTMEIWYEIFLRQQLESPPRVSMKELFGLR